MNQSFPEFALGIGKGLAVAVQTDIDVFLLATTGLLLGARSSRLRGLGKAMGGYVAIRRFDAVAGHYSKKLDVISEKLDHPRIIMFSGREVEHPGG